MKKLFKLTIIIVCLVFAVLMLGACSDPGAPKHDVSSPKFTVSVESLTSKLDEFVTGRENRTSFTEHERAAAEYLAEELRSYGYTDDGTAQTGMIRPFTATESNALKMSSRNVVAVYRSDGLGEESKNVIIGAYYDNRYSAPYINARTGDKSNGALANGTGVATALAIAEYLQVNKPQLDFTVTFAFFGGSCVSNTGVSAYYSKQMTPDEKKNTVLMIELQRIGVDHVYAFCDARETRREPFFDGIAAANGLDIYKPTQKSPNIISAYALSGIPYFQWAMNGGFAVFFNKNIPTLNLVGANWETIDLTDTESADSDNLEFTSHDTLSMLKKTYPDYGKKMATAASLVVESIISDDFIGVMTYDRENFPDTSVLTKNWIWDLVVVGIIGIALLITALVSSHLKKKYPIVVQPPKKMKMAVFGMEYEDRNPDEIYIDIKESPLPFDEIFPGVPNNDSAVRPHDIDGIFPLFPPIVNRDAPKDVVKPPEQTDGGKVADDARKTDEAPKYEETPEKPENDKVEEDAPDNDEKK